MAEPGRTAYDLNFQLFGFPIRIHPLFWLVGFILGFSGDIDGIGILIWMTVLLVSILVHELGHAFMIRRFGRPAHIVLYAMGGLAIEGSDSPYSSFSSFGSDYGRRSRTPTEQIIISFAGPAAGFLLAGAVIGLVLATGGGVQFQLVKYVIPMFDVRLGGTMAGNINLLRLIDSLLYVNIFWGLVNLLPIFPLDGGQIAQQLFIVQDPWGGMTRALWLSVICAAVVAVLMLLAFQSMFATLLFASLAVSNYLTLQQISGGGGRPW